MEPTWRGPCGTRIVRWTSSRVVILVGVLTTVAFAFMGLADDSYLIAGFAAIETTLIVWMLNVSHRA